MIVDSKKDIASGDKKKNRIDEKLKNKSRFVDVWEDLSNSTEIFKLPA